MPREREEASSSEDSPEASPTEPSSEEPTKSQYIGQSKDKRKDPQQEFDNGQTVRHTDASGVTNDCVVDDSKLEGGGWKYRLRRKTIDQPLYKSGAYIAEDKLVASG